MPEGEAVELLAEYVVLQEMPQQARVHDLSDGINRVFESGLNEEHTAMAAVAFANWVPWRSLLRPKAAAIFCAAENQPSAADDDEGPQGDRQRATWDSEWSGWNSETADQGNAIAQYNLGGRYVTGKGVPQDYTEAVR